MNNLPDRGAASPRFGHLGMWNLSLGPNSPVPGDRLEIAILDQDRNIVRRLEQIVGTCIDPGYVDFFNSPRCRPSRFLYPLVDIAPDGTQQELHPDFHTRLGKDAFFRIVGDWMGEHGSPLFSLEADEEVRVGQ